MCFPKNRRGELCVQCVTNNLTTVESVCVVPSDLPEHSDNPFINRDLRSGILGFRYENKSDGMFIVYTSIQSKTYCKMMKIAPLKKIQ